MRASHSYSGLSERRILRVTNKEIKYRRFNAKFLNKATPRPVRVENVFTQLQLDLVDMRKQSVEHNGKNYKYIFSLMDIFSRFHWLFPLQRKRPSDVAPYLSRVFAEHGALERLQSDRGTEFKREVKKVSFSINIANSVIYIKVKII